MSQAKWSVVVHGGASAIHPSRQEAARVGCRAAVEAAATILRDGGCALDAAEKAVCVLEDDANFNAGSGAVPTTDGDVELDAAIMDGSTLEIGAVAVIKSVRHPVSVARLLLSELPILLAGEGANRFAALRGIEPFDVPAAVSRDGQHDTVGCVARDQQGRVAVATSTGGLTHQMPGRVGDAPLPGCGFYADDHVGGVAVSGDGESIARILLASRVIDALYRHPAQPAVLTALEGLARVGGEAGIIALDSEGRFGIAHNSKHFALAVDASWLRQPTAGICSDDFERSLDG